MLSGVWCWMMSSQWHMKQVEPFEQRNRLSLACGNETHIFFLATSFCSVVLTNPRPPSAQAMGFADRLSLQLGKLKRPGMRRGSQASGFETMLGGRAQFYHKPMTPTLSILQNPIYVST